MGIFPEPVEAFEKPLEAPLRHLEAFERHLNVFEGPAFERRFERPPDPFKGRQVHLIQDFKGLQRPFTGFQRQSEAFERQQASEQYNLTKILTALFRFNP